EALVDRCGTPRDTAVLPVGLPEGSRKAELAGYAAALIAERGIAALSHRTVAARAGVANSNVAHYFRTHDDLLRAGMGALILGMRRRRGENVRAEIAAGVGGAAGLDAAATQAAVVTLVGARLGALARGDGAAFAIDIAALARLRDGD